MLTRAPAIAAVVLQHAEDIVILHDVRRTHLRSPHVALDRLGRLDARIAAHLDGCMVAGPQGFKRLLEGLAEPSAAAMFAVAAVVLEGRDRAGFEQCLAAAEAVPDTVPGLVSALGWVPRDVLAGIGRDLLVSPSAFRRRVGLAACRVHGVDPGAALQSFIGDSDPGVRGEALRTAGAVGRRDLLGAVTAALDDPDEGCTFQAARSAVLLGDRRRGLDHLTRVVLGDGPLQARAFALAFQAMEPAAAQAVLRPLAADPARLRPLIQAVGIVGDPNSVPWLIGHMGPKQTARVAGEAFSLIAGVDLSWLDLERKPPDEVEAGPNDDPAEDNVDLDPDDGLPWPASKLVEDWWRDNGSRFEPGIRHFAGAPVTREHGVEVLKSATQRQRVLAAQYLCLLAPGTPLFNTGAPAWRQRTLLAQTR